MEIAKWKLHGGMHNGNAQWKLHIGNAQCILEIA
jgi:hypothetical protein